MPFLSEERRVKKQRSAAEGKANSNAFKWHHNVIKNIKSIRRLQL